MFNFCYKEENMNNKPFVIIITGIPCTGKTTLSKILQKQLNINVVSKDGIKEILFDKYGFTNLKEKNDLNLKSFEELLKCCFHLIEENENFIVENDFFEEEQIKFKSLFENKSYTIISILLDGDENVIYERMLERDQNKNSGRHLGHISYESYPLKEDFTYKIPFSLMQFSEMICNSKIRQFSFGTTFKFDVTIFSDKLFEDILEKIRKCIFIDNQNVKLKRVSDDKFPLYKLEKIQFDAFSKYDIPNFNYNDLSSPNVLYKRDNFDLLLIYNFDLLIGFVTIKKIDLGVYELHRLCIKPEFQNKGIGGLAIKKIEEYCIDAYKIELVTPKVLKRNIHFYEKHGFKIVDEIHENGISFFKFEKKYTKIAVDGIKPSNDGLHLGHYIGDVESIIKFQDKYKCYVVFADLQLLNINSNYMSDKLIKENLHLIIKQMIALGVDFNKVTPVLESNIKKDKLKEFIVLSDQISDRRIQRMPLMKNEIKNGKPIKMSMLNYPILQALDLYVLDADIAFSNIDNKSCIEVVNEIFKNLSKKHVKLLTGREPMLVGFDGTKMSKSKNNCIFLNDDENKLWDKINKMYTDDGRIKINSIGHIEKNVVFKYLKLFDPLEYDDYVDKYQNGCISDLETKKHLFTVMKKFYDNYNNNFASIDDTKVEYILQKMYKTEDTKI